MLRRLRKLILPLLLIVVIMCASSYAIAHSGKTDSNGGHRDSTTGKYHYHHGYPAHSHKDIDGDGKKDCPYEFDDQTSHGGTENTTNKQVSGNEADAVVAEEPDKISFFAFLPLIVILAYLLWKLVCVIVVSWQGRKTNK